MRILEFYKNYPTEEACREKFKEFRLKVGVKCKKCGSKEHYWKKNREQWECKQCTHRTTLKSGTVMENSKLPFQYWFIAMHLLTSTKKSFSAKEVQRQIGHKRYQPIWAMLHKIRSVMGLRDDEYSLSSEIELDDGFFETVSINRNKNEPLKRERGSQRQSTVLVMAESKPIEDENIIKKYSSAKKFGFLKMKVIAKGFSASLFTPKIEESVTKRTKIISDGSTSYCDLKKDFDHQPRVIPDKEIKNVLPWVHTSISNAKRLLLDTHHRIDDDFLQNYLNAFVYKLNRRFITDIFENILTACVSYRWNYLGERNG